LRNRIGLAAIGDEINLTVDHGGAERTVEVRIGRAVAQRQRLGQR
jgi:hypothetical protein